MTFLQNELVNNYEHYVKQCSVRFKSDLVGRQTVHNLYIRFETNHLVPDDVKAYMSCTLRTAGLSLVPGQRPTKIDAITGYYETEKELLSAIGNGGVENTIDDILTTESRYKDLEKYLVQLSPKAQLIIKQRVFEEKTFTEIAKLNGFNVETTKAVYRQNLGYLKDFITGAKTRHWLSPKRFIKNKEIKPLEETHG
jgi:hypothetical protein